MLEGRVISRPHRGPDGAMGLVVGHIGARLQQARLLSCIGASIMRLAYIGR